jgi:hypothetical protein
MSTRPGAAGLLWLWGTVAELGPRDPPEPPSRPAPDSDPGSRLPGAWR